MIREPVVRVANTDISGCDCGVVWGDVPRASAEPCSQGRQGIGQGCTGTGGKAGSETTRKAGTVSRRCGCRGWSGADLDWSVRYLGRLHGNAERQEGLLRVGEAIVIQNQSAK